MKILVDGMPRQLGGIGTLLINLVRFNEKQGNRNKIVFEFLIPAGSAYINVLKKDGYKFYEVPRVLTKKYKKSIQMIFDNSVYEYVWVNNTSKVNIDLLKVAKRHGSKIIVHSHGVANEARGIKRVALSVIEKIHTNKYCSLIDIPFACSQASAEFFYPTILLDKCMIVSNGIEVEKFIFNETERSRIRSELGIQNGDVLIGAVGRLTAVKNYPFLAKVLSELPEKYKVIVLGEGEDEEHLKNIIKKYNIGNRFILLGKKENIPSYLSAMDIFAMPSFNEGMPFSLIEAQANGLKCLVSSGVPEEAKVIESVFFLSIDDQQAWENEIICGVPSYSERYDSNKMMIQAGYSIETSYQTFLNAIYDTSGNGDNK